MTRIRQECPARSREASRSSSFLLFPSCFLIYICRAHHPRCAAALCSVRPDRRDFAFACFALPRWHCPPASKTLGCQHERVDDQFFGRFLSLFHLAAFLLGRISVSVRPDWNGNWRHSRIARLGADSLGKPSPRTLLHSQPLARVHYRIRHRSTRCVRLVARYASWQRHGQSALVDHSLRHAAFPGSRRRIDSVLFGLLHRSAPAS